MDITENYYHLKYRAAALSIKVVNCISCLRCCELLAIVRSQLFIYRTLRHRHFIIVLFCLFECIHIPVHTCHMINRILCRISRESFAIRRCQLFINGLL